MKRLALVLSAFVLAGCGSRRTPPIQVFSDMKQQPKYLPQSESGFFRDGRALRRPVAGTVARGFLKEDDGFYSGKRDGAYAANPLPLNGSTLARGQERFNIYCAPCHDQTGSGQGIVAQRGCMARDESLRPAHSAHGRRRDLRYRQPRETHDAFLSFSDRRAGPVGDRRIRPRAAAGGERHHRRCAVRVEERRAMTESYTLPDCLKIGVRNVLAGVAVAGWAGCAIAWSGDPARFSASYLVAFESSSRWRSARCSS